jgi:hypothetical protein
MCLILIAWQAHPDYPLVVAANRDEFFARPRRLPRSGRKRRRCWRAAISKPAALVGNQPRTAFRGAHQLPRGWPGGDQCALARRPGRRLPHRCCQPVGVPGAGRGACRRLQRLQPLCCRRPAPGLLREPWRQSATLPEPRHLRPLQPPPRHPLAEAGDCQSELRRKPWPSCRARQPSSICSPTRKSLPIPTCRRPAYRSPGSASSRRSSCAPKTTGRARQRCSSATGAV